MRRRRGYGRRRKYYHLSGERIVSGMYYQHQTNSSYFTSFKKAKQCSLQYVANQMNNLLDAMQSYVNIRKQILEQKKA